MIKRILLTNDAISKVLLSTAKAPATLTADEINILKEVEKLLSQFQNATEKISGNNYVTVSMIIPIAYGLAQHLTEALSNNEIKTPEGQHLCHALIGSIKARLYPYELRTLPRIGTILDPRFKKEGFQSKSNADQAAAFIEREVNCYINICTTARIHSTEVSSLAESEYSQEKRHSASLFQFVEKRITDKVKSSRADSIIMMRQYFEKSNAPKDADPLLFWKICGNELQALRECAVKYFCVLATSVESERMFSSAGLIVSDRRTRLNRKMLT